LTPEFIAKTVEDVVGGITDEIRRTDSWKLFNELPEELIEFEEVPDRDRRFLGINWTGVFGRRTTQDQVEETIERLYSGDLDYFERTYRERATDILNKLEVETSSRFERITNSTVIRHTRSDVNGIPMYWAETPDGVGHWFQLTYTRDGRTLRPLVLAGEARGWIDVEVNTHDSGDGYVHAYNYNGGW
ncbi:MAG: hypothetical protein U9R15_20020, partial [Chloroflexota bacterium]|nr:hypothetical protein [Chloroflexota bacterium]